MQCYTELVTPSAITHAIALPFLNGKANNLVVAKTSLLQIYTVNSQIRDGVARSQLALVGEYPLSGTVTSLAAVKFSETTKAGTSALLISFRDAKLSLLEWDPANHRPSTISIHLYESENVINQPMGPSLAECDSYLTVDPSARCAALKFGPRHLAILPFKQSGDDLPDEEVDGDIDGGAALKRTVSAAKEKAGGEETQTPYKASFVLPLTTLDPTLTHPVDLAFLHEYRTPTLGILSASSQPSSALLEERKDNLTYSVYTLDLEQRASTNLVSLQKLPSDLWKALPLPLPIGGVLLVGTNEFVHVDQSGKPNAVAVNEFATKASNFGMTDQSALGMKLEGCEIEFLSNGDLLVVPKDGGLAVVSFKRLGRNVNGLTVTRVDADHGGDLVGATPSCVASLSDGKVFIGSDGGDSTLLGWQSSTGSLSRKRSHAEMLGHDGDDDDKEDEEEEIDDDDLYAPTADAARSDPTDIGPSNAGNPASYSFEVHDTLSSLGPINEICFGRASTAPQDRLQLLAGVGRQTSSRLAFISKELTPQRLGSRALEGAKASWTASTISQDLGDLSIAQEMKDLLFAFDGENTRVFDVSAETSESSKTDSTPSYTERTGTEFESEGETIDVGVLNKGSRLVQCRRHEIRTYDVFDLSLSQIVPMLDEETDAELTIVHTSFCDPYLLLIRNDGTVQILAADGNGDVEPLDINEEVSGRKWQSGCLHVGKWEGHEEAIATAFLLADDGGLHILTLPDLEIVYSAPMLPYLPAVLTGDPPQRRPGAKESLMEIHIADIGREGARRTYLILRSNLDDLTLYESFKLTDTDSNSDSWTTGLRWRKVPLSYVPKYDEAASDGDAGRPAALRSLRIGEHHVVCIPGSSTSLIMKEAHSLPRVIPLQVSSVRSLVSFTQPALNSDFGVLTTEGQLVHCRIQSDVDIGTGWCARKVALGQPPQEVRHMAYHSERELYVVATCRDVDFYFAEEDNRHPEQDDISLRPQIPQYTLHLLSARTHDLIHSFEMPYQDTVTSMKVMPLEVSEHTHEQRSLIVVGTAALRGEDMPAKGAVTVFEILDVVPDPDLPESGVKLHRISREDTRGAITAIEPFGNGLIGTAQGQKIMIRGLKEDGSCLPVAFLDAQCCTAQLKTLGKSGMWFAGDAWRGVWFGGFVEEPYKLSVLGKSRTDMEVVTAEFLPFDGQLFIVVIDAAIDLHVLQYDPENPKSLSGTRLLHRSTFHIGHFPTSMTLLPSSLPTQDSDSNNETPTNGETPEHPQPSFQILTTTLTGSIGLLAPVDEAAYRRLGALQTNLTSVLEHTAGLNPRAYRAVEGEGLGSRGVLDGNIVRRIAELGSARRAETLARAGSDLWSLRADLEVLSGGGLGFL